MAQSLNSTQTSSEPQKFNVGQAPLFTQWVGEPWVPSWVGDSNLVFNPHAFFPIEILEDFDEEDFDPSSMDHLE